jgi:hypothetical protein
MSFDSIPREIAQHDAAVHFRVGLVLGIILGAWLGHLIGL